MCEKGKRVSNNSKRHKHQGERKRERKRELGDRKPREETERKIGLSLDPFLCVFGGPRNVEEISVHLGASAHHANAPLARKAHIRARKYFQNDANGTTREFVSPSVVHSNALHLDLSHFCTKGRGNEG